jgi:acyl-lipid omega-6 desaturase (Delta-12 desaturase)
MTTTTSSPGATLRDWRAALAPYARPSLARSTVDILTSVVPYLALMVAMYLLLGVSVWAALALAPLAAGFLLRTYIVFHDCAHGSFMASRRANTWTGMATGLLAYSNFQAWKHHHAIHHATAGDLERRGVGDLPTLTAAEYRSKPLVGRLLYRAFRSPWIMFTVGPFFALVVQPRLVSRSERPRIKRNVHATNVALVVAVGALCWLIGWQAFLILQVPMVLLAGNAGIWLFYVQHQFEDVYWESGETWSYADAALRGSSHLKLPKVLQFFTGNIGLHHVHHLSARIPNYNLQRAHDEQPVFHSVPTISLWDGLRALRLKVYDEEAGRLVGWRALRGG